MARIKIEISGNKIFETALPVRITDINYGNHLGNDALVSIMHEVRAAWLHSRGFSELNCAGNSLILADLAVEYKKEVFYGDVLFCELRAAELQSRSFDLQYRFTLSKDAMTLNVATAKTGMVCFDYKSRKPQLMTLELRELLSA